MELLRGLWRGNLSGVEINLNLTLASRASKFAK